jgi:hypothetical protein
VHQARGPKGENGGTDCVGLLIGVAVELGIIEASYDPTGYSWETDGSQLRAELEKWATLVAFSDVRQPLDFWLESLSAGDIAVFKVVGLPQHTAFVSEIDYGVSGSFFGMIHAYNPAEKVIEHILSDRWVGRLIEVWRLK